MVWQSVVEEIGETSSAFDEQHFERADKFRQDLVGHLKDHMLTLQASSSPEAECE